MRPSWVEIDLGAVAANTAAFTSLGSQVYAVVKADGYGHGDVPVAETAMGAGASGVAVALVEEGVRLREATIAAPILLLSEPPSADVDEVLRWGITPTVYRSETLSALEHGWEAAPAGPPPVVHVKLDTGMHRVGADEETAFRLVERLTRGPLRLGGVWTHFAVAESDPEFTALQIERFSRFCRRLGEAGLPVPLRHLANTAGTILYPGARADLVRIGLGLYGLHPSAATVGEIDLVPAMRVVSHVSFLRHHPAGTRPSYGRRRALGAAGTVATVPIGYADGVPRRLAEAGGVVLIGGRRRSFAGTVTMDQIVVEVGDDPIEIGDEVVLIGRQGEEEVTAEEWADRAGTITYEIVCGFGPRLPRRYGERR